MGRLSGETALITGATRGLGHVFALHLAKLGANIGIIYRDLYSYKEYEDEIAQYKADNVLEEIKLLGVKACGVQSELTNLEQVKKATEKIVSQLGPITILICNAGGGMGNLRAGQPSTMDMNIFHQVIEKNLYTTANIIAAVTPIMKENKKGKIVTMSSVTGQQVNSDGSYSHYCAAKAAITQYTRSLAQELGPYGITANCMSPGYIISARLIKKFKEAGEQAFLRNVALKRFGTPEECAKVIEFLVSDMSDYVTGTVIEVNGGVTGKNYLGD